MATRCCMGHRPLLFFITLLFTVLGVSFCPVFFVRFLATFTGTVETWEKKAKQQLDNPACRHQSTAKERAKHAGDYFTLLRHLLNYAYNSNINLPNAEVLLNNEIDWLKRIRVKPRGDLARPPPPPMSFAIPARVRGSKTLCSCSGRSQKNRGDGRGGDHPGGPPGSHQGAAGLPDAREEVLHRL